MPTSWTLPVKTTWMAEQMAHVPTYEYAQEIYNVASISGYKNALEIGAAWGVSALAILTAGEGKLTSVDVDPNVKAITEVAANVLDDRWEFINNSSDGFFASAIPRGLTYDLVFIDGSHKYENAYADLHNGWSILEKGGILMVDDYIHPANNRLDNEGKVEYGISLALWELLQKHHVTTVGLHKHIFWTVK